MFTGAYMVNSPPGQPKLEAVCRRITKVWKDRAYLIGQIRRWTTMQYAHAELTRYEGLGGFVAYEIVCDLRYTHVLEHARDKLIWSNSGPGAIRGLYRLLGREIQNKSNAATPPVPRNWEAQTRKLLALAQRELVDLPRLEMREIEHSLCEYDKYVRLLFGEGQSKRRFAGAA